LLRALLLQVLYSIRSERMLMEQLESSLLFRRFVGLNMDEPVWVPTVFSKNRDRWLKPISPKSSSQARANDLLSDEHFSVDGTLIEARDQPQEFSTQRSRPHTATGGPGQPDR
jgi:transposase